MESRSRGVSLIARHRPYKGTDFLEDQQRINTFSKLNTRLQDIKDQLRTKNVSQSSSESARNVTYLY
jgi:DNA-binding transcriptional MerR regulator